MINLELAQKQNLNEAEIFQIEQLHYARSLLHEAIQQAVSAGNVNVARSIAKALPEIELELQKLWKFKQNLGYYKFWHVPGCVCPCMDNEDRFPYGNYVISTDCPVHGGN